MEQASRIPVLILHDQKRGSCLSIEPSPQEGGSVRLFKELSGTSLAMDANSSARFDSFLRSVNAGRAIFEDSRNSTLTKLLKRVGYRRSAVYDFPMGAKAQWRAWNGPQLPDAAHFGVAPDAQMSVGQASRRLLLSDKLGVIGEIVFSDYGRFIRAKANRFGSEGFGLINRGRDPSLILGSLVREMIREGKRYIVLGPEFREYAGPIHPFPLWHMTSSSIRAFDHRCRFADEDDLRPLATLVSEYEDVDIGMAVANVTKNMRNPAFRFLLPPCSEGFVLLKFMDGAEGMINDLYVSPAHQGKGIGDELTRASLSVLSESCINVHLNTIYPRARRLYEKYGFNVLYEDLCVALNQQMMVRS